MVRYILQVNDRGRIQTVLDVRPGKKPGQWIFFYKKDKFVRAEIIKNYNPFLGTEDKIIRWVNENFPELADKKYWVHKQSGFFSTINLAVNEIEE